MRCDGAITRGRRLERLSNAPASEAADHLSDHCDPLVGRSEARFQLFEVLQLVVKFGRNRLALALCTHDSTPMSTAPSCTLLSRPHQVAAQATHCDSAVSLGRYQWFPQFFLRPRRVVAECVSEMLANPLARLTAGPPPDKPEWPAANALCRNCGVGRDHLGRDDDSPCHVWMQAAEVADVAGRFERHFEALVGVEHLGFELAAAVHD